MELNIEKLLVEFDKKIILSEINLDLKNGNIYSLFGINGAGKSTFFSLIMQIYKQNSGEIYYDKNCYDVLPQKIRQRIGFLSEEGFLIDELTASQFLKFVGNLYNVSEPELSNRILDLFTYFFDDLEYLNKRVSQFSTGMKKKLCFCSAIIHLPDLLILDEPYSGLDSVSCIKLSNFLLDYINDNRLIVLSSHNLESSQYLNGIFLILKDGKIIFEGSNDQLTNFGEKQVIVALTEKLGIGDKKTLSWI
jgi:ABC-type multidrug transport system ATPase subunit